MARANFYARARLDRVHHLRGDAAWLSERLAHPESRVLPVWRDRNLVRRDDPQSAPAAVMPTAGSLGGLLTDGGQLALLGLVDGIAHFALDLSHIDAPSLGDRGEFLDLRAVGPLIDGHEGSLLAYARGLMYWHARHRFCGVCGSATESVQAGHQRRCGNPRCGTLHFPRTDPAVIMLVTSGDHCLLGRQHGWPPGMYSTLAGFVEPGESLEAAVAREVEEEAGIVVLPGSVRYHSSQPWPFPASIMLGFTAEAALAEIAVYREELDDARWFSRAEVLSCPEDERFRLPRVDSIARRLVEDWLGRVAP